MKILAFETSCDDTAVAVLEILPKNKVKVLANIISSQVKLHAQYGGVFPSLAAREHAKNIDKVFRLALKEAGLKSATEVDLMTVTAGPGLVVSLLVGVAFAKTLAWKYNKPLVGANHLEGHILSNWLAPTKESSAFNLKPSVFPALCLLVSGGHTELVLIKKLGTYEVIGATHDDAVGEAFDKVARLLKLGYPGGPIISKLAESGNSDRFPLPSPMIKSKNFDFSYSGLKTAVLYLVRDLPKLTAKDKADIAASFQKAAIEVLLQKTIAAAEKLKVKTILLSGGVSANKLLREDLAKRIAGSLKKVTFLKPKLAYTTDNAAMIGLAGYLNFKNKKTASSWKAVAVNANWGL
ncbi:MAG: tRNA (adenosine(37)-N6)-threonylcarbamoyltransferase complex transferase subunit TsaD [bacterium]|nr:tRNA (adenosine(37)-N6)-threonylcarbamoyltransferase complex transferase subunit TsaD [bacterium]